MNVSEKRFGKDYESETGVIGHRYRGRIMSGEVYFVKGFDNYRKDSTGEQVIVSIEGRAPLFRIDVKVCMFDRRT